MQNDGDANGDETETNENTKELFPGAQQEQAIGSSKHRNSDNQDQDAKLKNWFSLAPVFALPLGKRLTLWLSFGLLVIGAETIIIFQGQLTEMQKATVASGKSADAAQSAAITARDALVVSNRPWVGLYRPIIPDKPLDTHDDHSHV